MTRTNLRTLLFAAMVATSALAWLPSAEAQGVLPSSLKIELGLPIEDSPGHFVIAGKATYTAALTARTAVIGIPVEYHLRDYPVWASATISPPSDVFYFSALPNGVAETTMTSFTVFVDVLETHNTEPLIGVIEVVGTTSAPPLGSASQGIGSAPLHIGPAEPCDDHPAADAPAAEPASSTEPARDDGDVGVQTLAATPAGRPIWPTIAACGVLGALVGAVLYRRLR